MELAMKIAQKYLVECRDARGGLKWVEEFGNLVVGEGLAKYLDATLKTGLASPAWYVGLKGTGTVLNADALASHGGWSEINPYTGNRPAWTPGSITGTTTKTVDNSASKAVFSITEALTVYGAFMASVNTGTSGTLLGAGTLAHRGRWKSATP
ncbi:MAG: hypothetical protein D4R73_01515 [Deltaproteobacteria bacterium]|nr:MAG: hypothetical protein D4R73_01515 [Deltaproteobacteria bacterium]